MKRIAVVIPCYQAEMFIERAIENVYQQTRTPDFVIVVNDGSTDQTPHILIRCQEQHPGSLRVINQTNQGLSAARNAGMKAALDLGAEWVALLDVDDLWLPSKIERQMAIAENGRGIGLIYSDYMVVDENANVLQSPTAERIKPRLRGKDAYSQLIHGNFISGSGSAVLISAEVIRKVGYFDSSLPSAEDWDYWIRASEETSIDFVPEVLVKITKLSGSMSTNPVRMMYANLLLYRRLLQRDLVNFDFLRKKTLTMFLENRWDLILSLVRVYGWDGIYLLRDLKILHPYWMLIHGLQRVRRAIGNMSRRKN